MMPAFEGGELHVSPPTKAVFKLALRHASRAGHQVIEAADLLSAVLEEAHGEPASIRRRDGAEPDVVVARLNARAEDLERRFSPEFRNRIDEVVVFAPLAHDEVREIAQHYLGQVTLALAKSGKTIQVDDAALERIVSQGYSPAFGARFVKRVIDERIKLPITTRWHEASHFHVSVKDGDVHVEAAPAPAQAVAEHLALT